MGIVTHADVTDRKVAELEIESREEQLDVVRRLLTHDLRNPLSVIVGRLDQLEAEYGESDHLAAIRDATDRLYALGEHAPGFTTIDPKTEAEQLPFGPVARMAWDAVDPKGATLTVESDGHLLANKESLTLVLEGLFEHVSARSGSTRVWTGWLEDGFFVEDDGLELSEEELTAIHHTDFRSNSPTSIEWGLVRTVLAAQDWALEIEDGRDGGTRFEVVDVGFTVE